MSRYFRYSSLLAVWVLAACFGPGLRAQGAMAEFKRTTDHYKSLAGFSVKVSADFYTSETSPSPAQKLAGSVEIQGRLSHSVFDGKETLIGTDFVLVADHANRALYYAPRAKEAKGAVSPGTEILDSAFTRRYTVTEQAVDDVHTRYLLVPKKQGTEFSSISVTINRRERILKEIVYRYTGTVKYEKVVIRYSAFDGAWNPGKTFFTEARFISGRQKSARLQPAYSSYHLTNSFNYDPKKNLIDL